MKPALDLPFVYKSPDEVRLVPLEWADELDAGVTIVSSSWPVVPDALENEDDGVTGTVTAIKISGGELKKIYTLTNRIVTSAGETLEQSIEVRMTIK